MPLSNAQRLRQLLGEVIPNPGEDTDTMFSDEEIDDFLLRAGNNVARAAAIGWNVKAANYAGLMTTTEGNASRQASDLFGHATTMVKKYEAMRSEATSGRAQVGRIRRRIG